MVNVEEIASVYWDKSRGEKLRRVRLSGQMTLQRLADEVCERGYNVSKQYIQMLERPTGARASKTVSFPLLLHICDVCNANIGDLYDSPKIIKSSGA